MTGLESQVIDVHAHLAVPEAVEVVSALPGFAEDAAREQAAHSEHSLEVNRRQLGRLVGMMGDVEQRLADMDAMGVDIQVVGPMPMHHYWAGTPAAERFAAVTNEAVARHCAKAPRRLIGLGTAPLQHPEFAVRVLSRAVADLGLAGVSVGTDVAGRELADPAFEPFWDAAEDLDAMVLIHPWGCTLGSRLARHYLGNTVGNPVESAVALSHLIFSGLLDRHRRLRICASHGGGYLPTYIGRSDHAWTVREDARGCGEPPSSYLRRIWFDSLVYTPGALAHLVEATGGAGRVVLGTDYPFDMGVHDPVQRLDAAVRVPEAERRAIRGANAAALLGGRVAAAYGALG